jgi:hypothetical protein
VAFVLLCELRAKKRDTSPDMTNKNSQKNHPKNAHESKLFNQVNIINYNLRGKY